MATNAPTTQRGVTTNLPSLHIPGGRLGSVWSTIVDEQEKTPRLKWPTSVTDTIPAMLNDAQVNALRMAITMSLKRRRYSLEPNGASDQVLAHVSDDLGLPVTGQDEKPQIISAKRFSWKRHLHHVLLAPFYGHYYFSQFAPVEDGLNRLRKLLPLPPRTIMEIRVADDGGLEWVRQYAGPKGTDGMPLRIPVSAMVAYVWEQEAGNWTGRSMLRSVYRDFLAKDDLIRGNLIMHRRNGMGVPKAMQTEKDADGARLADVQRIAAAWRVGEDSAVGLPYGYDIKLAGVDGTLPDAVPSIKLHDEAMARSFLAMFMQLGQTENGARALGETMVDFFALALDAVAQDLVCDTTTLHVIRDLVDWNYGEDEQIPLLVSERDEEPELAIADMVALIDAGALVVDDDLEEYLRSRYRLPDRRTPEQGSTTARTVREAGSAAVRERHRRPFPRAASGRDPLPHEEFTDWGDLEARWTAARDALVAEWLLVRDRQIVDLEQQVRDADGNLGTLAALAVAAGDDDAEVIAERLRELAEYGVSTARGEATAQGESLPSPDMTVALDALSVRAAAVADLLSRALSEAAGRQAVQRTGGALAPSEVASEVAEHLRGLSNAYLEEQLGGALTQGMNTGRRTAMGGAPAGTRIVASALLDTNVCARCHADDGHEYDSLLEAESQFPIGGNKDCEGGIRCRCTLVAIYPESAPSVE